MKYIAEKRKTKKINFTALNINFASLRSSKISEFWKITARISFGFTSATFNFRFARAESAVPIRSSGIIICWSLSLSPGMCNGKCLASFKGMLPAISLLFNGKFVMQSHMPLYKFQCVDDEKLGNNKQPNLHETTINNPIILLIMLPA